MYEYGIVDIKHIKPKSVGTLKFLSFQFRRVYLKYCMVSVLVYTNNSNKYFGLSTGLRIQVGIYLIVVRYNHRTWFYFIPFQPLKGNQRSFGEYIQVYGVYQFSS